MFAKRRGGMVLDDMGPLGPDHTTMEIVHVKNGFMINVSECKDNVYTYDVYVFGTWKEAFEFIDMTYKEPLIVEK